MKLIDPPLPDRWCVHPDCGRPIVTSTVWRNLPPEHRRQLRNLGRRITNGRELCPGCHKAATRQGTLERFPRSVAAGTSWAADELAEEWDHLTAGRGGTPRAELVRELAPRLGMTTDALERALDRRVAA